MPKSKWGPILSGVFAIALTVTPVPNQWRLPLVVVAWLAFFVLLACWWQAPTKLMEERGDLHLTILHFDYDDHSNELVANLMFRNADVSERTVLGVTFLFRPNKEHKGWEFYSTGQPSLPFIGHINPLKIPSQSEETRQCSAKFDSKKLQDGAEVALHITFTAPNRGHDSATVIAMQLVKTADLCTPTRSFPVIKNFSLDSIAKSKEVETLLRGWIASQRPL